VRLKNMVVSHTTTAREWWWTVNARVVESCNKVLSRKDRTEFARKWWWTVNARVVVGEQSSVAKSGFENEARSSSLSVKVAPVLVRDLSPSIY
jgi:hypothetical protein